MTILQERRCPAIMIVHQTQENDEERLITSRREEDP
jgi:hypothetical protein